MRETWTDTSDTSDELKTIRDLMERARDYRHLPHPAAFVAAGLGIAGGVATELVLAREPLARVLPLLGGLWLGIFLACLASLLVLIYRAVQREGAPMASPLALDLLHGIWPSFISAVALTLALAAAGAPDLIPPVWMLAYGAAGIVSGNHARWAVRGLGLAFLVAGLLDLFLPWSPGVALGVTFGGFHLVFGLVLASCPTPRS